MGLPIWRNPDESKPKDNRTKSRKDEPFAPARSSIRRRPEVYGRNTARARALQQHPPRLVRTTSLHGLRRPTQRLQDAARSGIPAIRSLFEAADRVISRGSPPPPVPESTDVPGEDNATRESRIRPTESGQDTRGETADAEGLSWEEARRMLTGAQWNAPGARPHSRDGQVTTTSRTLPTPPYEDSPGFDAFEQSRREGERILEAIVGTGRPSHPLRYSWRPGSPNVNGLGDRTRSPSPGDGWELMRTTITPDETLPSAESSFTSATASRSFGSSNPSLDADGASSQSSMSLRAATRRGVTPDAWALIYGELPCNDDKDDENESNDERSGPGQQLGRLMFLQARVAEERRVRLADALRE